MNDKAIELLRRLEWSGHDMSGAWCCPECSEPHAGGRHDENCDLRAVLDDADRADAEAARVPPGHVVRGITRSGALVIGLESDAARATIPDASALPGTPVYMTPEQVDHVDGTDAPWYVAARPSNDPAKPLAPFAVAETPIEGETLGTYRERLGLPGIYTSAARTMRWGEGAWRRDRADVAERTEPRQVMTCEEREAEAQADRAAAHAREPVEVRGPVREDLRPLGTTRQDPPAVPGEPAEGSTPEASAFLGLLRSVAAAPTQAPTPEAGPGWLDEVRARVEAATPDPMPMGSSLAEDIAFIAHARVDVDRLLEVADAAMAWLLLPSPPGRSYTAAEKRALRRLTAALSGATGDR